MRRVTMHSWAPAWKWPSPAAQTRHCPSWGHQHSTGDKETRAMSPLPPQCHTPGGATSEETREHLCTYTAIAFVIILTIPTKLGSNTEKELLKLYLSTYFSYFFTLFGLDQLEAFHWQRARRRGQELTICWRKIPFPPKKEICWCYLLRQTHIWPSQSWGTAYGIGKKRQQKNIKGKGFASMETNLQRRSSWARRAHSARFVWKLRFSPANQTDSRQLLKHRHSWQKSPHCYFLISEILFNLCTGQVTVHAHICKHHTHITAGFLEKMDTAQDYQCELPAGRSLVSILSDPTA